MSDPMFIEEQAEVLAEITDRLEITAPPGWNRIILQYVAIGDNNWGGASAVVFNKQDQMIQIWKPPIDVDEMFAKLRAGMSRPGRGSWMKVDYVLYYPDYYSVDYANTIDLSEFYTDNLPTPADCIREMALFPRTEGNIPHWMHELLGNTQSR
ncbi:hypothetical protein [Nocardia lasii]|uniref:DUF600 family protein n=1 Tax=Nocardia lasii TaxID=1616107 RepID=A0ABW1JQ36_9NOCA